MTHALTIARKDVADSVRSLTLWAVVGLFALLTVTVVGLPPLLGDRSTTFESTLGIAAQLAALVVPMIGLMVAYHSITSERESGSLRVLLSLPPSRRAIVVGKLLGRGAVIVLAGAVAVLLTGVVGAVLHGSLPAGSVLALGASVALMGLSFVGVAIGVSAAVSTRGRAMALTVTFYMITVVFWNVILQGIRLVAARLGLLAGNVTPAWLRAVSVLPPNKAFSQVFTGLREGALIGESVVPSAALALVVMIGWILVPPALGYLRFRSTDLG